MNELFQQSILALQQKKVDLAKMSLGGKENTEQMKKRIEVCHSDTREMGADGCRICWRCLSEKVYFRCRVCAMHGFYILPFTKK